MKRLLIIGLVFRMCLLGCSDSRLTNKSADSYAKLPNHVIDKSALFYDTKTSTWTLNGELYSGYVASNYPDKPPKERFGVLNGRKQNVAIYWNEDGYYRYIAHYHKGKLEGTKKTWSGDSSHQLLSQLNYVAGKLHGEQIQWYPSGELYKKLNMNMGREEGLQQGFRKNGVVYANYEARDGRFYGLKKAKLCYGLEDENIKTAGD